MTHNPSKPALLLLVGTPRHRGRCERLAGGTQDILGVGAQAGHGDLWASGGGFDGLWARSPLEQETCADLDLLPCVPQPL